MNKSFLYSLMAFQARVLDQGYVSNGDKYTMQELKDKLFFNRVFHDNCEEMFSKYRMDKRLIQWYIDLHKVHITNVALITKDIAKSQKNVRLTTWDSFERRWTAINIADGKFMTIFYDRRGYREFPFKNGVIYYICPSKINSDTIAINFIDPKSSVYESPFCCESPDKTTYWKTDDCIRDMIADHFGVSDCAAVKVTLDANDSQRIKKVEYNGSQLFMSKIAGIFGRDVLIISNPILYLDDVEQIIDKYTPPEEKPIIVQRKLPVDLMSYLDKDQLIEYPVDSFDAYLQFLKLAATSPDVSEIYLTLYRIGKSPAIFYILRQAVRNGINVHVNIELCASGEDINQRWKTEMERVGIHVTTYAAGRLKVHSKLTLVVFENGKRIAQVGTGNYHTKTTEQYTDLSLITGNEIICNQIHGLFRIFNGGQFSKFTPDLLVTQYNCREVLLALIDREAAKGTNGLICFKCNALDDEEINAHLTEAASNGCQIDMTIRGVCTWIPEQLGQNVRIRSFVWDKLEHSRVYSFGRENPMMYIGSLDLVTKKIDMRIETLVRIIDPEITIKICDYLNRYITNCDAWHLTKTGEYRKG